MRSTIAQHLSGPNPSTLPPPSTSAEWSEPLAKIAQSIIYRCPLDSREGRPVYVLNSAAFPSTSDVEYNDLLGYVLARLPPEDDLIHGNGYELIFFAGGDNGSATGRARGDVRPGLGWFIQAYRVLSRALRKKLQKLYIVHERTWVRVLVETFSTIVSPKFRKKIIHASTLGQLALSFPIENLMIPPSAYMQDRRFSEEIYSPYASGRRAYGADQPLPSSDGHTTRLPRVLRETTSFILLGDNIDTEGVFRVSSHAVLLDVLTEAYDRAQKFIVWREGDVLLEWQDPSYPALANQVIHEVDIEDAYGVHLAADVIRRWYSQQKSPLIPTSSYDQLKTVANQEKEGVSPEALKNLFSPNSTTSTLPKISREIMVRHLIPLLWHVQIHKEKNKMPATNLARCFTGSLIQGDDLMAEAQMIPIIIKLLAAATEAWEGTLATACGVQLTMFLQDLKPPEKREDYEDPLSKEPTTTNSSPHDEKHGQEQAPPPLPPRPSSDDVQVMPPPPLTSSISSASIPHRKPAPAIVPLPPYSDLKHISPSSASSVESDTQGLTSDDLRPRTQTMPSVMPHIARKPAPTPPATTPSPNPNPTTTSNIERASTQPTLSTDILQPKSERREEAIFIKPTLPASATRAAPPVVPRRRTPSPALMQRTASFERQRTASFEKDAATSQMDGSGPVSPLDENAEPPQMLRKGSVESLRRMFEERANLEKGVGELEKRRDGA